MRTAVTVILALTTGIHCSAPGDRLSRGGEEAAAEDGPAEGPDGPRVAHAAILPEGSLTASVGGLTPAFARRQDLLSKVTSSVIDDDGTFYGAGTFSGVLAYATGTVKSRGGTDIFVVKVMPDGTVAWLRSVGSYYDETSPRVTLGEDRVKLLGLTDGNADCGSGPLHGWSSETFFLCTYGFNDGNLLEAGAFPTGVP